METSCQVSDGICTDTEYNGLYKQAHMYFSSLAWNVKTDCSGEGGRLSVIQFYTNMFEYVCFDAEKIADIEQMGFRFC